MLARALISDVAQRVLTLNKLEQRQNLSSWVRQLRLSPGARILDFGCGTGLFATTLRRAVLEYCGYDPDVGAVRYASRLYPGLTFVSSLERAFASGPYDAVLANCCFHHIGDDELLNTTLPAIARLMRRQSIFMLIDVLPLEPRPSVIRRIYNACENGANKRNAVELERLLAGRFVVRSQQVRRSFAFSVASAGNPIYNDVIEYELVPA